MYSTVLRLTNKPIPQKNSLFNIADKTDIAMYEGKIFVYPRQTNWII